VPRGYYFVEMLKKRPWRRLVHQFCAATILLSVLSVGSVAFAPSGGAATTQRGGTTIFSVPIVGKSVTAEHPRSLLCHTVNKDDLGLRNQESNLQKAKSGNWKAYQDFMLAFEKLQSQTAQAVINVGRDVPANVSTAARQEVKDVTVLDKSILKSKNMATLNASWNDSGAGSLSAWNTVFYYVGGQCGLTGGSTQGTVQTVGGNSTSPTASTAG
jgi:hypothetical protein